ncbi:hypothetical protein LCER1_G007624 [Lachnellula cervina]|uniref:Uncharacterized protein n=1 Tax=Lachnellula cervina TaxID=1316786 RepID=A0A7D8Z644_9HELO|nr:hypothetical protein LCER1_G007624 [Lachnellula cervina]
MSLNSPNKLNRQLYQKTSTKESYSEQRINTLAITEDMANFSDLPSELRNKIYELCLWHEGPIDPWNYHYPLQELTPGLLLSNKAIHREASPVLYAQNSFDFTFALPENVASFLGTIGHNNADYSTNDIVLKLDTLDYPKIVTEALTLVNTRFRAILSLQDIIIQVYEDGPSEYIKREMENLGWTVSTTEYVDEWGSEISFGEDDCGWDDHDDDDDGDSYDIDKDSDFWRRAGD